MGACCLRYRVKGAMAIFRITLSATFESFIIVSAPTQAMAEAALLKQRTLLKTLFDDFRHPEYACEDVIVMGADDVDIDRPQIDLVVIDKEPA